MRLVAYRLPHLPAMALVPATRFTTWAWSAHLPRQCLPMQMASSSGWLVINPAEVTATWDGTAVPSGLKVTNDPLTNSATSIVGHGVLSWQLPHVIRTPPGWSLSITGPVNQPRDGAAPLSAVVETDTGAAMLSINWAMTRPGSVVFEAGAALAQIAPVRRGEVELFEPEMRALADDPELLDAYADAKCARQSGDRTSYTRHAQVKRLQMREFRDA